MPRGRRTIANDEPIQFIDTKAASPAAGTSMASTEILRSPSTATCSWPARLDQEALALQRQGELGLWLQSWGQEAAQAGSMRALRRRRLRFPELPRTCRGYGPWGDTGPAACPVAWRHALGLGPARNNFHFYSLVLGTQTLHATGYAMGTVLDGGIAVTATYFGDGAASQGDVNEAMNWALLGRYPSCSSARTTSGRSPRRRAAAANSALPTRHRIRLARLPRRWQRRARGPRGDPAAAAAVRSGEGPALIEAETFRMAGHSTSDDPGKYRSAAETEEWKLKDPLVRLRRR